MPSPEQSEGQKTWDQHPVSPETWAQWCLQQQGLGASWDPSYAQLPLLSTPVPNTIGLSGGVSWQSLNFWRSAKPTRWRCPILKRGAIVGSCLFKVDIHRWFPMCGFSSHSPPNTEQVREGSGVFIIMMLRVARRRLIPSTEHMHAVRQRGASCVLPCVSLTVWALSLYPSYRQGSQDLENVNNTPESRLGSHRVTIWTEVSLTLGPQLWTS